MRRVDVADEFGSRAHQCAERAEFRCPRVVPFAQETATVAGKRFGGPINLYGNNCACAGDDLPLEGLGHAGERGRCALVPGSKSTFFRACAPATSGANAHLIKSEPIQILPCFGASLPMERPAFAPRNRRAGAASIANISRLKVSLNEHERAKVGSTATSRDALPRYRPRHQMARQSIWL